MPASTPKTINPHVVAFSYDITSNAEPTFVKISPVSFAQPGECFYNIKLQTQNSGGSIAYGWCIWQWRDIFIEAEHHAVWETTDGDLLDITPPVHKERRIVFLRDDTQEYDFKNNRRKDNIRRALNNDPVVVEFLNSGAALAKLQEDHSVGTIISLPMAQIRPMAERHLQLTRNLYKKYLTREDLCTCFSGKIVKKCCRLEKAILALPPGSDS